MEDLFSYFNQNYIILHGHEIKDYKRKYFFYVSQSFLMRWLYNIDIFFSLNVCEKFPIKSKNIYMHHDISTAPLVEKKKEKQLFERLIKYNYIFISGQKSKRMFDNLFIKYNTDNNKKIPKIFCVGYYKLDYLVKKFKKIKGFSKQIVIAPSDFRHIKEITILNDLNEIINKLLLKTNYKIIFRPYPNNRDSKLIKSIKKKFEKDRNFSLDMSDDYFKIYSKSLCLITDISGTAYTYAFATEKPVIFYSPDEKLLKKNKFLSFYYFIDRNKIGITLTKFNQIKKKLIYFQKQKLIYKKRIISLRNQRIKYFNKSLMRTKKIINYL